MSLNKSLGKARVQKDDEFYTQLGDIENEMKHYTNHFKGKVIYCNADDPRVSNFFHYFSYNFERLGLKKLITTCYQNQQIDLFSNHTETQAIALSYEGEKDGGRIPTIENIGIIELAGDGDFRGEEASKFLEEADIVITNPPFSLFREYISLLTDSEKEFIILGNQNALSYKEIFPLFIDNKLWLGRNNGDMSFKVPDHYLPRKTRYWQDEDGQKWRSMGNISWYTNLDHDKRHEVIPLYRNYYGDEEKYPRFDNYDVINVDKVSDIPVDYFLPMGVPITFLTRYNPKQFEILDANDFIIGQQAPIKSHALIKDKDGTVNGVAKYVRIVIRRKRED